jgi:hypothetical protein
MICTKKIVNKFTYLIKLFLKILIFTLDYSNSMPINKNLKHLF